MADHSDNDRVTSEVYYAAETLMMMANDKSGWTKPSDSESGDDFATPKFKRKMGSLRKHDAGISSNSLPTIDMETCSDNRHDNDEFDDDLEDDVDDENYDEDHVDDGSDDVDEDDDNGSNHVQQSNDELGGGELVTPSVHTRFPFSIIHLVSSVRLALVYNHLNKKCKEKITGLDQQSKHTRKMVEMGQKSYHSVDEIIDQVRVRPGDPRILQAKVGLEDLIRGTLRVFAAKTKVCVAKKLKKLAVYDKPRKGWSWIGSISCLPSHLDVVSAICVPEFWGISRSMLVKLVDCFADWFDINQNALEQRACLPPPPLSILTTRIDFKERFLKVAKCRGCPATIKPSSAEVRAYFHDEERIRYMIPDRAFAYTAADGRKSSVAPVRKCGEKASIRARDHNLLKWNRPSSITILTIVRDAAARLPGGIGTRGDVGVLVRDSQYLEEGISDEQISQVVSGGLDRLHYERDPCVRFDRNQKLWVYLHGDREEEDFDDDGRQSTIVRWTTRSK